MDSHKLCNGLYTYIMAQVYTPPHYHTATPPHHHMAKGPCRSQATSLVYEGAELHSLLVLVLDPTYVKCAGHIH